MGTLATGRIDAVFHCLGTTDVDSDRFSMSANGAARNGALILKNQAGILSSPVAVGRTESRILVILQFLLSFQTDLPVSCSPTMQSGMPFQSPVFNFITVVAAVNTFAVTLLACFCNLSTEPILIPVAVYG